MLSDDQKQLQISRNGSPKRLRYEVQHQVLIFEKRFFFCIMQHRLHISIVLSLIALAAPVVKAQPTAPSIVSWVVNTSGATGYGSYPTDVQSVKYSDSNVYLSCTCIPGYDIGPWNGDPNKPVNQDFLFKITRYPKANTGTPTATPLGHIGIWSNGVSMFNAKDANSYQNAGVWNQNAIVVEGSSFDSCLGHPAPNGEYHHHLNPVCIYNDKDSLHHSPIIGYAFDGFPIYGAYGYSNADGTGGIRRMSSSYQKRSITERTTLPNGTVLSSSQYGPAVSTQYPLGYYIEDFEFVKGLGDLDQSNGRFCVTPDYPQGTYAYFVTIDSNRTAVYPYTLGPDYYGVVQTGDIGQTSGHISISEPVQTYTPLSRVGESPEPSTFVLYPNPAKNFISIDLSSTSETIDRIELTDERGVVVYAANSVGQTTRLSLANFTAGSYVLSFQLSDGRSFVRRFEKE